MPYYFNGTRRREHNGSEADRAQLTDFETAKAAAIKCGFTGIGFALLSEFNITVLDFDTPENTSLPPEVETMIAGTYAEYSPSGTGVHAFIAGNLGNHKSGLRDYDFGFETFATKGYVTFTGNILESVLLTDSENTILPPSKDIEELYSLRFGEKTSIESTSYCTPKGLTTEQLESALSVLPSDYDYDDWLQVGMALHHETNGAGFELWESWSIKSPKYSSRQYNQERWNSFGRYTDRIVTIYSLVKRANELGADIRLETATDSDFEVIESEYLPNGYFNIRSASDFIQDIKPISWLIKGFLPRANLGVLYGESGTGKSFVALDICAALGQGNNWQHYVLKRRSRILYVVAEGISGFHQRIRAYCLKSGIEASALNLDIISDVTPNLTNKISVDHLIKDIKLREPYDLIVMDTFAQVTAGSNENSGEDMGKALGYCKTISQVSGAMVLLIHHSGKDASKGARGWSGIHAAADVVYEITRFDEERCLEVIKQKDGRDGLQFGFTLENIVLDKDEDGDEISSCIINYCDARALKKKQKPEKLGELEMHILNVLHDLIATDLTERVAFPDVVKLASEQLIYEGTGRDKRAYRVQRAIEKMITKEIIIKIEENNATYLKVGI